MLEISRIQAITLDLDDTLWPIWPTIAEAELRLQAWLAPRAPATASLFGNLQQRQRLRDQVAEAWPQRHYDLSFIREEMIRLGLRLSDEDTNLAEPAFAVFFAARQQVTLFDDSLPALQKLSARWPILALSNGNADVERIGLADYFCGSVSARDVGAAKPDARIFLAAAARLQLAPEAILHVGDDESLDVLGAQQAGMQTAWVNRSDKLWAFDSKPSIRVTSMAELSDALLGSSF
jgi:putative hydrolase of the HAD superfamily